MTKNRISYELTSLTLLQIILFFNLIFSIENSPPCHRRSKRVTEEFKKPNQTESLPYLVSIYEKGTDGGKHFLCSGTLLSPNLVLTAAHCLTHTKPTLLTVLSNPHTLLSNQADQRQVIKILKPSEYGENFKDIDLCLLRLQEPFPIDNLYIRPIELCGVEMHTGDLLQASCSGRALTNASYIDWRQCAKQFQGNFPLTRNHFCGKLFTEAKVCLRDAGGPVVHKGNLCGIVLRSSGWLDPGNPEIYSSIKPIRRLIAYAIAGSL